MWTTPTTLIGTVLAAIGVNAASAQPVCFSAHLNDLAPIFSSAGRDVAISGNTAVVGAPFGWPATAALVFEYSESNGWELSVELHQPDGDIALDGFGLRVAVEGDVIAVASANWDERATHPGSVYIFRRTGEQWAFEQKLFVTDTNGVDGNFAFGGFVIINQGRIAVGGGVGSSSTQPHTRVYFYEHDGRSWVQTNLLIKDVIDAPWASGLFSALALEGEVLIAGLPNDGHGCVHKDPKCVDDPKDPCQSLNAGRAFIFRYDAALDEWIEEAELQPVDVFCENGFGRAVAADGDWVLVSASFPKRVYALEFDDDSGDWVLRDVFHKPDVPNMFNYGRSIDLHSTTALIGADDGGGACNSAFIYERTPSDEWIQRGVIDPLPTSGCNSFGRSVALTDNWAILGAPTESPGGAAYIFDLEPPTGDLNCDEFTDVTDLLLMLNQWGACPQPGEGLDSCFADLNGDGTVNVSDLLEMLVNWG